METPEDGNLDELMAAFKQLENKSPTSSVKGMSIGKEKMSTSKVILQKYGIYIAFFVYLIILILILQPYHLFKKNEETQKYKFMWKKFFMILFISYAVLVSVYLGVNYYLKKTA